MCQEECELYSLTPEPWDPEITSDHFRSLQMFFFRKEFWSARYKEKSVENELSGRLPEAQQKLSKETKRNLETEKRFNV